MLNVFRPLLLITAISLAAPVFAQDPPAEPRSQREDAGNRVRQVEREGGRVLQAEPMQRGGRETYRIKVLTPEGRVRVLDDRRGREALPARVDRRESTRERATPRDRQGQRAPEVRRADPPPDAGEPPRQRPRRGDDGDSRRN